MAALDPAALPGGPDDVALLEGAVAFFAGVYADNRHLDDDINDPSVPVGLRDNLR